MTGAVFSEITGGATSVEAVTLPHDAMLAMPRSPEADGGASSGYFAGGAVIYRKSFVAPLEWRSRVIELEFASMRGDEHADAGLHEREVVWQP